MYCERSAIAADAHAWDREGFEAFLPSVAEFDLKGSSSSLVVQIGTPTRGFNLRKYMQELFALVFPLGEAQRGVRFRMNQSQPVGTEAVDSNPK